MPLQRLLVIGPSLLLLCAFVLGSGCNSSSNSTRTESGVYEFGDPTRDGTGKYYMGREIALVMGHRGAGWLERSSRATEELPDRLVQALDITDQSIVADIGAGTGYFSFRISKRVPNGKVFAVDIQPEMLSIIRQRAEAMDVQNVVPVQGTAEDPQLPEDSIDVALMVDAYHEFSHPYEMAQGLMRALKPGGRIYLVEYRGEDPTVPIKPLHKMTEAQARAELEAAGFLWRDTRDFLPQQHVLIFEKPVSESASNR